MRPFLCLSDDPNTHFNGILYSLCLNTRTQSMLDPNSFTECFCDIPDTESALEKLTMLPQAPGVYLFYGINDTLLYVGKSIDLRARVRSHYYARHTERKEQRLIQQTHSIRYQVTDSELSALLLENQLVKQALPLHNRRLRRTSKLLQIQLTPNAENYYHAHIGDPLDREDTLSFGTYRSVHKARKHLTAIATEHHLCQRILGLENGKGRCFAHQLKRCKGACVGTHTPAEFNRTLIAALAGEDMQVWPYEGTVWFGEEVHGHVHTWHAVNQWNYLGKATDKRSAEEIRSSENGQFDLDTYRILINQLQYNEALVIAEQPTPPFYPQLQRSEQ